MTGREVLEQVREHAKSAKNRAAAPDYDEQAIREALWATVDAVAALSPCVVLTAEEAHSIATVLDNVKGWHEARMDALALLTSEDKPERDEAEVLADLAQEKADRLLKDLP